MDHPSRNRRRLERLEQRHRALAADLSKIGTVLQGSLADRWMRCGKAACQCQSKPEARHGPYHVWTYKRAGKTVCIYLNDRQAALCAKWIANNRRLEKIIGEMRSISRRIAALSEIPIK